MGKYFSINVICKTQTIAVQTLWVKGGDWSQDSFTIAYNDVFISQMEINPITLDVLPCYICTKGILIHAIWGLRCLYIAHTHTHTHTYTHTCTHAHTHTHKQRKQVQGSCIKVENSD